MDVELVQDAWRTIQIRSGDCDDKVTLLASMLACAGYLPRFVCGGQTREVMDHVWVEVYLDWCDQWLPLDPTNEHAAPGWFQAFPYRLEYEIFTDEANSSTTFFALILLALIAAKGVYA